jgi:iron complex outermembrane receptor protein
VNNNPGGALNQLMGQLGPNGQTVPGSGCLYCTQADLKTQSEALFGQLDYSPNSEWHFTGGIRYSWDQKQGYEQEIDVYWIPLVSTQAQAQAFGFPQYPANWPVVGQRGQYVQDFVGTSCSSPPQAIGIEPLNSTTPCPGHRNLTDKWGAPTGTASVSWTPNADTNVYARYSRGYKSGGFNLGALVAGSGEVDPEYINDYEGGWKQNFLNGSLQTNMAVFYYQYFGLQANNATVQNSSPPIVIN